MCSLTFRVSLHFQCAQDLDPYFDFIAVAGAAKCKKPGRGIFDYAAYIGDYEMDDSWVHIGDNIEKDFKCVNEFGGNGVLLNRFDNAALLDFQMGSQTDVPMFDGLAGVERYLSKHWRCT